MFSRIAFTLSFIFYSVFSLAQEKGAIIFATTASYPPFEFIDKGKIVGFDIDIAKHIANRLNKNLILKDVGFSSLLMTIDNENAQAVISTLTITKSRLHNFDFSLPYYYEKVAILYRKGDKPESDITKSKNKTLNVVAATTIHQWVNKNCRDLKIISNDRAEQAINALRSKNADMVMLDYHQARYYAKEYDDLAYFIVADLKKGYGIAVKKGSPLLGKINNAIREMRQNGELLSLENKWLN